LTKHKHKERESDSTVEKVVEQKNQYAFTVDKIILRTGQDACIKLIDECGVAPYRIQGRIQEFRLDEIKANLKLAKLLNLQGGI
jgi:hypothetical protein